MILLLIKIKIYIKSILMRHSCQVLGFSFLLPSTYNIRIYFEPILSVSLFLQLYWQVMELCNGFYHALFYLKRVNLFLRAFFSFSGYSYCCCYSLFASLPLWASERISYFIWLVWREWNEFRECVDVVGNEIETV